MDIESFRLGLAYCALKQALGEDCAPLSFSASGLAFLDRKSGASFFCLARRGALFMARVGADGSLGDGADPESRRLKALAEPAYLARENAFEREIEAAQAKERRQAPAQAPAQALPAPQPSARAPARPVVVRGTAAKA